MKKVIVSLIMLSLVMVGSAFAECGYDCRVKGKGLVGALSISGSGAIIGTVPNGALAGSGALALTGGIDNRDMVSVAKTDSLSFVFTERGNVWNTELNGREYYRASGGYTESKAVADTKLTNLGRRERPCLKRELNVAAVAGISASTSSIGTINKGGGSLAAGVYLAGAISNDKLVVKGSSDSLTQAWKGTSANGKIQWAGSSASNVSRSSVNFNK